MPSWYYQDGRDEYRTETPVNDPYLWFCLWFELLCDLESRVNVCGVDTTKEEGIYTVETLVNDP